MMIRSLVYVCRLIRIRGHRNSCRGSIGAHSRKLHHLRR